MVVFNMLWKLFVVVAFGLSATVTSTEVAQEQPKEESLIGGFSNEKESTVSKPSEVKEATGTSTPGNSDPDEPPMFTVEWYLLPKPLNRATLRYMLPWNLQTAVPEDCKRPILPVVERQIRNYFSWLEKTKQKESSSAQGETTNISQPPKKSFTSRFFGKKDASTVKPVDVPDLPKYSLEWYFVQKPENRKLLRDRLPYATKAFVAPDCREPIAPVLEKRIRDYFSLYTVDWYLLPKQENRIALRYMLPSDLAAKVPEDCNEPIDPEVEAIIKEHFTVTEKKQRPNRFWYLHL
ncbi:SmORF protein [Babesia bovis T2Bo]|uniref:SmORF n=1 Tax=Babesia bovis TaxID=5865 RepID=A7AXD8_BABBO|nr:SmORF protein [Babesia bovis T2Bo]EDO05211.1 SmORF protein [Babesia bovis T2Bo]|eukprot:XP_001608779.1 SmORF [Babesia bovis T2Bo]